MIAPFVSGSPLSGDGPRVLVFSERNVIARKSHALQYEFEDVGTEVGLVDVVAPRVLERSPVNRVFYRISRSGGRGGIREKSIEELTITDDYDLFFAFFAFPSDIAHIQRLKGWRRRCKKAVCFIDEHYTAENDQNRRYFELLRELGFDHVYIFNTAPKEAIASIVGCPVRLLA